MPFLGFIDHPTPDPQGHQEEADPRGKTGHDGLIGENEQPFHDQGHEPEDQGKSPSEKEGHQADQRQRPQHLFIELLHGTGGNQVRRPANRKATTVNPASSMA